MIEDIADELRAKQLTRKPASKDPAWLCPICSKDLRCTTYPCGCEL